MKMTKVVIMFTFTCAEAHEDQALWASQKFARELGENFPDVERTTTFDTVELTGEEEENV